MRGIPRLLRSLLAAASLVLGASSAQAQLTYVGCSDQQKDVLAGAWSLAFSRAKSAEASVGKNPVFERWFGTWSPSAEAEVASKLAALISDTLIGTPQFTCAEDGDAECPVDPNTHARALASVFRGASQEINVCPAFWGVDGSDGYDQTDILLHEASHFHLGAATDDHCYDNFVTGGGVAGDNCINLARSDPEKARDNGDSYMLFIKEAF